MGARFCLVTGANGFFGSRLVRQLVERGERVKALVRAGSDLRALEEFSPEQVHIAVGDVRMVDRVYAALRGCDRMYHTAATHSFNEKNRRQILTDSIGGTEAALTAARRAGIEHVVVTSSIASLGVVGDFVQLGESGSGGEAVVAKNSYAYAKAMADAVTLKHAKAGLSIVSTYPAMMVGPGDWRPTPMGRFVTAYLNYPPSFRVPVAPGGVCLADVDDVAAGHIAAMQRGSEEGRYLLGGENLTHREILSILSEATGLAEPGADLGREKAMMGARVAWLLTLFRGGAPLLTPGLVEDYFGARLFVDDDVARTELGYSTRPLRQSLVRSCRWFLDNGYVPKKAAKRARLELSAS
jgi:dihydroflavonol-4-reductase